MSIAMLPEVLRWQDAGDVFTRAHEEYVNRVSKELGARLRALREECPARGDRLLAAVQGSSDASLMRVLLAPETTSRLLYAGRTDISGLADFLDDAFLAEEAIEGHQVTPGRELWTALGDARVLPTGGVLRGPSLMDRVPLDFDSPNVRLGDPAAAQGRDDPACPTFTSDERGLVLDRLAAAAGLIAAAGPDVSKFVTTFTKIVVLLKDRHSTFSSGSAGQYIGRSVIGNPHAPAVGDLDLAEALVHEAIHALLYMHERWEPWVPARFYPPVPCVVSPWSGRNLALRPFLQACFVWYGILHFWSRAISNGAVPVARASDRLARAAHGFLRGPLLPRLTPDCLESLSEPIRTAVGGMQARVVNAFR